jgi:hypothetical protein
VKVSEQWAVWFRLSAVEAEDLTEGQREGFRIAAEHLESPRVQALVAKIIGEESD